MTAANDSQAIQRSLLGPMIGAVDRLIPAELLTSIDSRLRARVLIVSSCGVGLLTTISQSIRALTLPLDTAFWLGFVLIAFLFSLPLVQYLSRSARLAGGILSLALGVMLPALQAQIGFFPAPVLAFFPCFPLLLTFFLGLRVGLVGTLFICGAVLYLATTLPVASAEQFAAFLPTFIATGTIAPLLAYHLAAVYELNRIRNESELTQQSRELHKARNLAENADQRKTVLLRHISHELRTPLNAILGYSELLQEELAIAETLDLADDAGKIAKASYHLLSLINGLLDISKIESGTVELKIEEIDVHDFFLGLRDTLQPLVHERNNTLEFSVDPSLGVLKTDRQRLLQLVLNLAGNACKFTSGGRISITATSGSTPDWIRVTVVDTGVGMSTEKMTRIFDPFVQVDDDEALRTQGSGLGLAITKKIVLLLGGSISVESTPEVGSCFIVELPRSTPPREGRPVHESFLGGPQD